MMHEKGWSPKDVMGTKSDEEEAPFIQLNTH